MELSLSLNSLKFANVTDFNRSFGIKKQSTQNGGSLTTKEFNDAIALPYDIQRPVIITENTTVSDVEHDARLLINANGITLSLTNGTEGIQLEITSNYAFTLSLAPAAFTALPVGVYVLAYKNNAWSIIGRDINYIESQMVDVEANPNDSATQVLQKLKVNNVVYEIKYKVATTAPANPEDGDIWIS